MPHDLPSKADELVRYHSELVRRIAQAGVRDLGELLALHEQLSRALAAVSAQEIGWAADLTQGLIDALVVMDSHVEALRGLKATLEPR